MQKISIEDKGAVAILRLTNGVTNAIGPELVKRPFYCKHADKA